MNILLIKQLLNEADKATILINECHDILDELEASADQKQAA
ncbi:hypothetical protein [Moritella viscosa]|uniref:Phage protein n=1 Tax=Moritella viscosa TaxID=80854 RepID=A0ABY1HHI7_9GAMM|nr:hypothetical protein [Moritella viscosa]SGY93900.1 unnamed protein product [Moritella viscosa]SGZ05340.1 unnamed protein product [Moritella viscosa]SHO26742.1 unnamed protein product [Moritella viscosa]